MALARAQHGVVGLDQLLAIPVTARQVQGRIAAGWLLRLHRGVFAVAGQRLSWRGRWLAAVLACGEGALLSHLSAASLWRLTQPSSGRVDVTLPAPANRRSRAGIRVHRSLTLDESDRVLQEGIPVTSVRRTVLDVASSGVSGRALERLVDEAERLHRVKPSSLIDGTRGSRGPAPTALRELLAQRRAGSSRTRTELERRFFAICREHRLPNPLVNASLLGLTVDFFWPAAALVVELDGRGSHDTDRGFQDDRDRDSMLAAAGFRTLRFTWWDVERRPQVVAQRVRRVLGA